VLTVDDTKKLSASGKRLPPAAGKGRPKGAVNKLTKDVRAAIQAAFDGVGGAEWLMQQAQANPVAFMTLLGKIIPAQVQAEVTNPDGSLRPSVADMQTAVIAALARKHDT
jgi:hypothetical protein